MLAPILAVKSIENSLAFYTKTLGFEDLGSMPGPDGTLIHGMVTWKDVSFMFGTADMVAKEDLPHLGKGVEFYIDGGDADIDAYYKMLKEAGVNIVADLKDEFWGHRTFSILDPDGYRLTFAKQVREVSEAEMAEAVNQMG